MRARDVAGYQILRALVDVERATCAKLAEDLDMPVHKVRHHVRVLLHYRLLDLAGYVRIGPRRSARTVRLHPDLRVTLP